MIPNDDVSDEASSDKRRVEELLKKARAEVARARDVLAPVADARKAAALVALCDTLETRLREAERLTNPLHQPHSGKGILLQRIMRRLTRPTLEHQVRFNAAMVEALRAEAQLLHAVIAALAPAEEKRL